jgi:hypothetical protein
MIGTEAAGSQRCAIGVGTRLRPKMRTPKKLASSKKAVNVSYIRSGPLDRPGHFGQHAPIGAKLKCRHDPRHHAQPECHTEYFQPEVEYHAINRAAGRETQRLENGEPGCQPDRKGWKDDMEGDGERELYSRQEKRRHIHCNSPGRWRELLAEIR